MKYRHLYIVLNLLVACYVSSAQNLPQLDRVKYVGVVIDSNSQEAIPLATLFVAEQKAVLTDEHGRFVFYADSELDSVIVFCHGYRGTKSHLYTNCQNTIALRRIIQTLPEIIIKSKETNVLEIVKMANENRTVNYHTGLFRQKCFVNLRIAKSDTPIFDKDYIINYYNILEGKHLWVDINEIRKNLYDASQIGKVGFIFMSPYQTNKIYFLYNSNTILGSNYKRYEYKLLDNYVDSSWGEVFSIQFTPKRLTYNLAFDFYAESMIGKMVVRKEDYAIVAIEYLIKRKLSRVQKNISILNRKQRQSSYWDVMPEYETISLNNIYSKDSLSGKYILSSANYVFLFGGIHYNGSYVEQTQTMYLQPLHIPRAIESIDSVDFKSFRSYGVDYHQQFWDTFNLSNNSSYYLNK